MTENSAKITEKYVHFGYPKVVDAQRVTFFVEIRAKFFFFGGGSELYSDSLLASECIWAIRWHQRGICWSPDGLMKAFSGNPASCGALWTPLDTTGHHWVPQNAIRCHKMPQDATRCHKTPQDITGRRRTPQDATGRHRTSQDVTGRHRTPQDATGRRRTPQDATGHCGTYQCYERL